MDPENPRTESHGGMKSSDSQSNLSIDGARPPPRKAGWANFQAWTRQWNRFFATLFCILAFSLLFAIVVVNVINAERGYNPNDGSSRYNGIFSLN